MPSTDSPPATSTSICAPGVTPRAVRAASPTTSASATGVRVPTARPLQGVEHEQMATSGDPLALRWIVVTNSCEVSIDAPASRVSA